MAGRSNLPVDTLADSRSADTVPVGAVGYTARSTLLAAGCPNLRDAAVRTGLGMAAGRALCIGCVDLAGLGTVSVRRRCAYARDSGR